MDPFLVSFKLRPWFRRRSAITLACAGFTVAAAFAAPATAITPEPRYGHIAVYDPVNTRMIVWGGRGAAGQAYEADVWVLPLTPGQEVWQKLLPGHLSDPPPIGEYRATAVWDPDTNRVLVFGGQDGVNVRGELYQLRIASGFFWWTRLTEGGQGRPYPRYSSTSIWDPQGHRMLLFGGGYSPTSVFNDTWQVTFPSPTQPVWSEITTSTRPSARSGHTASYDSFKKRMVVFGGHNTNTDLWTLRLTQTPLDWTRVQTWGGSAPAGGFALHTMYYDRTYVDWWQPPDERKWLTLFPADKRAYVISLRDTTGFEGGWGQYNTPGLSRWFRDHAAVFDPVNDRAIVFGGVDAVSGQVLGETWVMSTGNPYYANWFQIATSGPSFQGSLNPGAAESTYEIDLSPRVTSDGDLRLEVTVPAPGAATLEIFDVTGRLIRRLDEHFAIAGRHEMFWDGKDGEHRPVSRGVFFARFEAAGKVARSKLILAR